MMLISPAYAQAGPGGGGDLFVSILPLLLIFVVFYFLLIRPQQQKVRTHRQLIEGLKKGDQVVTGGGIIGKIARVEADDTLAVEIAPNVQVRVARGTISDVVGKPPAARTAATAATTAGTSNDNASKPALKTGFGLLDRFLNR